METRKSTGSKNPDSITSQLVLLVAIILGILGDRNPVLGLVALLALARVIG